MPAAVAAEALAAGASQIVEMHADGADLWWIELDPSQGRYLIRRNGTDLTPPGRSASSRVHEYGGAALRVDQGQAWFVDTATQDIVEISADGSHRAVTTGAGVRYGDLVIDRARNRLLAICEDHRVDGEPRNSIVSIELQHGAVAPLVEGRDFYTSPRLDRTGTRLAYVAWDHPAMPWDAAQLIVAEFDRTGLPRGEAVVAGGGDSSAGNPVWAPGGSLHFAWDRDGWWHLWRYDAEGVRPVSQPDADYGAPGLNHPDFDVDEHGVVAVRHAQGRSELVSIAHDSGQERSFPLPGTHARLTRITPRGIAVLAGAATDAVGLWLLPRETDGSGPQRLSGSTPAGLRSALREPELVGAATRDGARVTGHLYRPVDGSSAPWPLVVHVHGGPIMSNPPVLVLGMYALTCPAYWTTRGYAYLDVDYRGTLRYGRRSWQHLHGRWGVSDVEDAEDLTQELISIGVADRERIAIRGASAGGWTVCHAMTRPSSFTAGTALFPVTDLLAFRDTTHKFESRYVDSLVGPFDDGTYSQRSPISRAGAVHGPMLFVQGSEDRVCPPAQSAAMVEAIRGAGGRADLLLIDGEGHGFVRSASTVAAFQAEEAFYREVFTR